MPIKNPLKGPGLMSALKTAAAVAGAASTILGLWWAITTQIEVIIDKKNKEMLVAIDQKVSVLNSKMQDNTAVILGTLANDYRDRLTLIDYEIQQDQDQHMAIPFNLYTQKKQLEENLENIKKWQN